jgi:hypothetical protein
MRNEFTDEDVAKKEREFFEKHFKKQKLTTPSQDSDDLTEGDVKASEVKINAQMAQTKANQLEDDRVSKKTWSHFIMGYLSIFTLLLFFTIWSGHCIKLNPVTLNILISVGFTKVVAIAYIVVKHFYPLDEIKRIKNN